MVEGEATQEPNAPESAPASPPAEPAMVETAAASQEESSAPVVEAVAQDWSHVRAFQSVEPAPEALGARADYADELKKELAARAARFGQSVDESIVLSNDGLIRWLGDPLARLTAGERLLQPSAILLADEALTGDERGVVETRLALWLAAHVRKVLGPLVALADGAELPEAARGLAGKVAEALGVLEREPVRNDVRALDQTARGALRKLGVRFGSLYIFVPALLKPGARGLCSLLWTLKRGADPGADRLLGLASAGRTSFANEGTVSPDAYRVAGFRLCGERVVRVDIIERLSDLIRAAIPDHMRGGARPDSEAYGFLVTPQMTSLTGCAGDAFASILRSLGFEPVKVSKAAFELARATAPTQPLKPNGGEAVPAPELPPAEAAADDAPPEEAPAATDEPAVETAAVEPEAQIAAEAESAEIAIEDSSPVEAESTSGSAEIAEAPAPEAAEGSDAEAPTEAAPDEEIEIWRPAPRRARMGRPHSGEAAAQTPRGKPHRRHSKPSDGPREAAGAAPPPASRPARPEGRDDAPRRFEGKRDQREERRPSANYAPRREQRPAQIDPDSPFAKLAALKPLLERRDKRP
jgi:ATP-dependent RNA helicase SUPV3L1/SUV3